MVRRFITSDPFSGQNDAAAWNERGTWPSSWIAPHDFSLPFVVAFRLRFDITERAAIRVHVSADERYELWIDGERCGRGPERGDCQHWFFETYDLTFEPGAHVIVARVWALGELAPFAQFSVQPGFLFCPQDQQFMTILGTGHAPWESKLLDGYSYTSPLGAFAVGHNIVLDGTRYGWGWEHGAGDGWLPTRKLHAGYSATSRNEVLPTEHLLLPATLPAMLDQQRQIGRVRHVSAPHLSETHSIPLRSDNHLAREEESWMALLHTSAPLTIPPNTRRRVIIDLENYYCAYPEVVVSGGDQGSVRIHWLESLFPDPKTWERGHRGDIDDHYFTAIWWHRDGIGDRWILDGGMNRRLDTLWWQAGRYVEVVVETSNDPLTIEQLTFRETRYPLELESQFISNDDRLARVTPIAFRGLQMCAHETYMDCPYFEQLMYIGDTRLQCLVTYATNHDDRLPRKALRMFDWSRLPNGFTLSRYPTRLRQVTPPFSLWWVTMVYDYLMWRDDGDFVRSLLPGVRNVLDAFTTLRDEQKLVRSPEGWNYIDWVPAWPNGSAPGAMPGEICGVINWMYVYTLTKAAVIEEWAEEVEIAARHRRLARETALALGERYWNADKGLYADDAEHTIFTEHSQLLAVLSGVIPEAHRASIADGLFTTPNLTPPSVWFMHYFFEVCCELERVDKFWQRMDYWFEMEQLDFKTTYELGDPRTTRSDCHAWGAHPLYHYFATLLGIQPASPGFATVQIAPQLGPLEYANGRMVHPRGEINVDVRVDEGKLRGIIHLPEGVMGRLQVNGVQHEIAGIHSF